MARAFLILGLLCCLAAAEPPPLPAEPVELHGTLRCAGAPEGRFWARLLSPDKAYGGHRMLQLVYDPPRPESLAGTVLVDCPFVLLDAQLRLVAWNGRQGLSQVTPRQGGYHVVREVVEGEGLAAHAVGRESDLAGPRAWDLRLAPLLVALAWRPGTAASVRCLDFFGPGGEATVSWEGAAVTIAGASATAEAGPGGRLHRLVDAHGAALVAVDAPATP